MRYQFIILIFIAVWAVMMIRLYHVSIKSNYYYEELAKENIERKEYLKPVRGEITDVHGKLLAMNQIGFSVSVMPHLKEGDKRLEAVGEVLAETFPDLNTTVLYKVYRKQSSPYNHKFIKVVDFIPYADMMGAYAKLSLYPEIKIEAETKRYYPYGKYVAHLVGYTGRSNQKENEADEVVDVVGKVGKSGLERYYNKVLQGELGYVINKVTATNRTIEVLEKVLPKDNKNLTLNIDIDLQQMIYQEFADMKETGVAIVMRTTGEIVAAVSYPAYDPNLFVGGISSKDWRALQEDLAHPFTNKITHGTYPPGSTIKMGMALAFDKAIPGILGQSEYCNGFITIGKSKHKFRCWKHYGHGDVHLRKAIRESCDVFFYKKSLKVGIDDMAKNLHAFGLGVKTGVDLPREYNGVIPDKAWKMRRFKQPWYKGETVIASIGQGYDSVTPLQVARYTALIATGNLVTPRVAKLVDGNVTRPTSKPIRFDPVSITEIRKGMYDVCNTRKGTAYKAMHDLPVVVAGKTGTSQVTSIPQSTIKRLKESELEYFHRSHAWITTYAPYNDPQYVVTVLVEHGGHGGSTSGPMAAMIYKWLYAHNYFKEREAASQNSLNEAEQISKGGSYKKGGDGRYMETF
ncbi:penicillin-binding protein 2 [Sulfurovum sp. ST-21]|uniref:Penicillin-binding protein 2 n=1 Tax=Sulfurovum indicum TaxID=2779528 RepID=A0A7M1S400_9BACT|nr:penicillin-binding protein 2 [Sulfurovum indicum]QOR61080.1 penicillin-binding protein 2 [Sulfurovum indicum]